MIYRPLGHSHDAISQRAIRLSVGCALIIRLIIQTILLYPSGAGQVDAEHPSRNRKVELESLLAGRGQVQLPTSLRWR